MALKKQKTPKRWRSKEARDIAKAVEEAGGTVERTAKGHLKVTGPAGTATVASAPDSGHQGGRALANTWATLTRETGLTFPGTTAESSAQSGAPRAAIRVTGGQGQQASIRHPRHGVITRWNAGDTYGFATSSEGVSWFVSRDSLADGETELPEGTPVTFRGILAVAGHGRDEITGARCQTDRPQWTA
jgi:hypothetical protein